MRYQAIILTALLSTASLLPNVPVLSQSAEQKVTATQAQGLSGPIRTITVWPGVGTNLSVIPTGETIKKAFLDDPSQIGLDFDGPLCAAQGDIKTRDNCEQSTASVIHLRLIKRLNFKQLPQAQSRTVLTVVTEDATGKKKLYPFWVSVGQGEPQYQTLTVYPDTPPLGTMQTLSTAPQIDINQIERGVEIAHSRGLVHTQQPLWLKLQRFMGLAHRQVAIPDAAQQAGISMALVRRLSEIGSPSEVSPPSFSPPGDGIRRPTLPQPLSR